jgi:dihydroorotase
MPNTNPVIDSGIMIEYFNSKTAEDALVNVLPVGALTKGQQGKELAGIGAMAEAGAVALSEDGKSVSDAGLMRAALVYAAQLGLPVLDHCEELSLVSGCVNDGAAAARLGVPGCSGAAEEVAAARDIILARETKAKLHICHVSSAGTCRLLREAKARGERVTAEAAPHHFTLTDSDIADCGANYKMNPPLRGEADVQALKEALHDGIISVIATDHAPHHYDDKNLPFEEAANGVIGLETAVALGITELVEGGWLTPSQFIAALTENPAKILGISAGTLTVGAAADATVIDPRADYVINAGEFLSKARNTPFDGRRVKGRVVLTVCGGKIVYRYGRAQK